MSADSIVPDPTIPQSFNRYSYTRNNPLNLTDPTGQWEQEGAGNVAPPPPPGVENATIPASVFLQEFLSLLGITQSEFNIPVHINNAAVLYPNDTNGDGKIDGNDEGIPNPNLFRYEVGAWTLTQEHRSFHPRNYTADPNNLNHFRINGIYTAVVLLQVIYNDEAINNRDVFEFIQSDNNVTRFAYPEGNINDPIVYNDYLIVAYLSENGAFPGFLASYPGSGEPYYYGHWNLVDGIGEYYAGRESLSVSSWAFLEVDWVPSLSDFYSVVDPFSFNSCKTGPPC